jgi:hypothetical protein
MFPGIDIAGLAVGILRKMGRQGGIHGMVDVAKGLVGICFLSILYVLLLDALGLHAKEQFEILHSNVPLSLSSRPSVDPRSLLSHRSLERAPWTIK